MLAQGAGVGVGLGAAHGFAVVGLGRRVDLRVFLAVAAVGEAPLAKLTLEWLLTCNTECSHSDTRIQGVNQSNKLRQTMQLTCHCKSALGCIHAYARVYRH